MPSVTLTAASGNAMLRHGGTFEVHDEKAMDIEEFFELSGRYDGPVYSGQQVRIADVVQLLAYPIKNGEEVKELQWAALECAAGRFPQTGFRVLWLGFGKRPQPDS